MSRHAPNALLDGALFERNTITAHEEEAEDRIAELAVESTSGDMALGGEGAK